MVNLADIGRLQTQMPTPPRQTPVAEGTKSIHQEVVKVKQAQPTYTTDNQDIFLTDIIREFRSVIGTVGASARKSYNKALSSLEGFTRDFSLQYEPFTTRLVADWMINMRLNGNTFHTIALYLNAISSLSSKLILPSTLPDFTLLRTSLKNISEGKTDDAATVIKKKNFIQQPSKQEADIPAEILLALHKTAVIAGGISLEAAARLQRKDLPTIPSSIAELTAQFADPRRQYLFPLNQSAYTPRQLAHKLSEAFEKSTNPKIRQLPSPAEAWFKLALKLGATPSEVIDVLKRNPLPGKPESDLFILLKELPADDYLTKQEEKTETAKILKERVAEVVTDDPLRWYAMHLRQGIKPDRVAERISLPETFYPTHPVAKRTPQGIHHSTEPLMPGIIFFRSRESQIQDIFRRIGDIAWCYRDPGLRNHGYATIPDVQMQAFQLAIGIFTEETRVAPLGTIAPRPGQKVIIIGGPLSGYTAKFQKIKKAADPAPVLYRLSIPGTNGIEWEADLDPRILDLLPEIQ